MAFGSDRAVARFDIEWPCDGGQTMADLLNVNVASAVDLDAIEGLTGHGFEIARYREERGNFDALRQLDEVPGLSGKVTDEIKARLTV